MKILIMVLTYMKPPYDELYKAQTETWDSIEVDGVSTIYYHGGLSSKAKVDSVLTCKKDRCTIEMRCTDSYYYMAEKLKLALDFATYHNYDCIFRTNSSSYINKQRLKEFAETLPKEKLYAGWTMTDSEDFGGLVVSGAGIFLSRDTAEILRQNIDPKFEQEEDIYCGRILRKHGIVAIDNKSRYDVNVFTGAEPDNRYHYRFKGPHGNRLIDAEAMRKLHKLITL